MSIATMRGDHGETGLIGGRRVSKACARIDAIGEVDELGTQLAFARAICPQADLRALILDVQRQLFAIGETLATDPASGSAPAFDRGLVDALSNHVHRLEAVDGILLDWAIPGEDVAAAAFEMARAACRRAERSLVRLKDSSEPVDPTALAYLNRLADLLWLIGRLLERDSGAETRLRRTENGKPSWSRAW
jgi:cob(I)alamin adenosyltransferase